MERIWYWIVKTIRSNKYYIKAGTTLDGLSDNKAYLLSVTYTWMFSSSNRNLRDRVSKAMIEILNIIFWLVFQIPII